MPDPHVDFLVDEVSRASCLGQFLVGRSCLQCGDAHPTNDDLLDLTTLARSADGPAAWDTCSAKRLLRGVVDALELETTDLVVTRVLMERIWDARPTLRRAETAQNVLLGCALVASKLVRDEVLHVARLEEVLIGELRLHIVPNCSSGRAGTLRRIESALLRAIDYRIPSQIATYQSCVDGMLSRTEHALLRFVPDGAAFVAEIA